MGTTPDYRPDRPDPHRPADAAPWVPQDPALDDLAAAVTGCSACALYASATHAVMGEGPVPARVMLVAEQPQRLDDQQGRPFVGKAGMLLRRALADAGLDPDAVYLTNVLKHSRRYPEGPPRTLSPDQSVGEQVRRCLPWLRAELRLVRPRVVVSLGPAAIETLLGPGHGGRRSRGLAFQLPASFDLDPAPTVLVTSRPVSVQRSRQQSEQYARLVGELAVARDYSLY